MNKPRPIGDLYAALSNFKDPRGAALFACGWVMAYAYHAGFTKLAEALGSQYALHYKDDEPHDFTELFHTVDIYLELYGSTLTPVVREAAEEALHRIAVASKGEDL